MLRRKRTVEFRDKSVALHVTLTCYIAQKVFESLQNIGTWCPGSCFRDKQINI